MLQKVLLNSSYPKRYNLNRSYGFTLIELLVVIAIIGLLSSILLVAFSQVREKSRDARRMADLKQLRSALELYYSKYGCYPLGTSDAASRSTVAAPCPAIASTLVGPGCNSGIITHWNTSLQVLVDDKIIPRIPLDPLNQTSNGKDYCYNYSRVRPNVSGWSCGGVIRTDFAFTVSFAVERTQFPLPVHNQGTYSYCMVGDKVY